MWGVWKSGTRRVSKVLILVVVEYALCDSLGREQQALFVDES